MPEAVIIDACRTPRGIGKVGKGALTEVHPQRLAATVLRALKDRNELDETTVDDVIWGTSSQTEAQGGDLGRMALLDAEWDPVVSGVTLDRFCGSGITTVNFAAGMIGAGFEQLVVAGGTEMMSTRHRPRTVKGMDRGNPHLDALHPQSQQGVCADVIAHLEGISREAVDALAYVSQQRAATAIDEGRFERALVPVVDDDGKVILDHEEYPRPATTPETLAGLKPAFEAMAHMPVRDDGPTYLGQIERRYGPLDIEHVHHAGNSSGVVDGAAGVLLADHDYAKASGFRPRARVVAAANVGDDPTLMLNAPVPAARKVLDQAGMTIDDIDLFEVNEAFAVVTEKFIRDLDVDRDKVNVNGGSIALGHPIGATGAILIGTVLDELERQDKQVGLVTMCAAGGMAPAIIIERI